MRCGSLELCRVRTNERNASAAFGERQREAKADAAAAAGDHCH
jgi:hypothetical protein